MQENDGSLRSLRCEIIKCKACQEGGMIHNRTDSPQLVKIQVVFVNPGLLGAVEDGQDVRRTLATLGQERQ